MSQIYSGSASLNEVFQTSTLVNTSIPVTLGTTENYKVIFSEYIGLLYAGDVLQVLADIELTRPAAVFSTPVCKLILGTSATDVPTTSGAVIISGGGGTTFSHETNQGQMHLLCNRHGVYVPNMAQNGLYVNFCVKAQSSAAIAGWALSIESNGCNMVISRFT